MSFLLAAALATATVPADRERLIARWTSAQQQSVALLTDKRKRAAAQKRFDIDLADVGRPPAATPDGLADLGALAAHELRTPGRYALTGPPPSPPHKTWWQSFWEWVSDRWNDLMDRLLDRAHVDRGQAGTIGLLLIAFALVAIGLVVYRMLATVRLVRRKPGEVEALESPSDARALYTRACERARAGDYALASRLLFAATVTALDLRGVLKDRRSATVGDLRRGLRGKDAGVLSGFDRVAAAFITSTYAERPLAPEEWERARAAYESLGAETAR